MAPPDRSCFVLLNSMQCPTSELVHLVLLPFLASRKTDFLAGVPARCGLFEEAAAEAFDEVCDEAERERCFVGLPPFLSFRRTVDAELKEDMEREDRPDCDCDRERADE